MENEFIAEAYPLRFMFIYYNVPFLRPHLIAAKKKKLVFILTS